MKRLLAIILSTFLIIGTSASTPSHTLATLTLATQIQAITGITRHNVLSLQTLATQRTHEISTVFQHRPLDLAQNWGEVIGWSINNPDPAKTITEAWMASPPHHEILIDTNYTNVGCGSTTLNEQYFAVCIFTTTIPSPTPTTPTPTRTPSIQLPNTSIATTLKS